MRFRHGRRKKKRLTENPRRLQSLELALACGRADVDRFLEELPGGQLEEWLAFSELRGFPEERMDARLIHLLHLLLLELSGGEIVFDLQRAFDYLPASPPPARETPTPETMEEFEARQRAAIFGSHFKKTRSQK